MDERRVARVAEAVREELSELIGFELDDPRLSDVSVTDVRVSPDGHDATVRVALGGGDKEQRHALAALDHAKGYLRRELASRLELRHVPDLHFEHDEHPDVDSRVDLLLKRARRARGKE